MAHPVKYDSRDLVTHIWAKMDGRKVAEFERKSAIDVHGTSLMSPKIRHRHQVS